MNRLILLTFAAWMLVSGGFAQILREDSNQGTLIEQMFDTADKLINAVSSDHWTVIPALTYSPETSIGIGARAIKLFRPIGEGAASTRPSTVPITLLYTLNQQLLFTTELNLWQADNVGYLNSRLELADFPFKFYGFGNSPTKGEFYASRYAHFHLLYERKVAKGVYIGPVYEFRQEDIYRTEPTGMLESGNVRGSSGQVLSGVGGVLNYDTRENIFQPTSGAYHQARLMLFSPVIGSSYSFAQLKVDFRKYFSINPNQVLAVQAWMSLTAGAAPFQQVSLIGGSDRMRGYFEGKYRDRHAMVFQSEYRLRIYRNLGLVFFGSTGQVTSAPDQFRFSKFKVSGGMGFRYKINEEGLSIRLDFGVGDQFAYYFGLNEVI
ncbi:BamA/TamA family outer membrane protein [Lunatimonas salinarum]|uniref:BamA/TamA family outer membrane protein n=1 Tax=Lunatimonas salinarum TaxID=1774590 RepID=UPI001ADF86C4|nr:BamA/TamA family outer membrane protein [Lunatimonas salinarum]